MKPKYALAETQDGISHLETANSSFVINCSKPNPDLFHFDGIAQITTKDGQELKQLSIDNFIPRGAILRNAGPAGILALCLYTGPDCKLILNQGKLTYKKSNLEVTLNRIYIIQALSVAVLSIFLGSLGYDFMEQNREKMLYVFEDLDFPEDRVWILILTFWLLLVRYLPLDVVLLSETGKIIYSKFMEYDARMMTVDKTTNGGEIIACKV